MVERCVEHKTQHQMEKREMKSQSTRTFLNALWDLLLPSHVSHQLPILTILPTLTSLPTLTFVGYFLASILTFNVYLIIP